jgi:hypothetical protein
MQGVAGSVGGEEIATEHQGGKSEFEGSQPVFPRSRFRSLFCCRLPLPLLAPGVI